jgi:hypothetical protein
MKAQLVVSPWYTITDVQIVWIIGILQVNAHIYKKSSGSCLDDDSATERIKEHLICQYI